MHMSLIDKQKMYTRFQSKMESACYQCVDEIAKQHNIHLEDTFINDTIVPEIWDYLSVRVPILIKQHDR
jgi:hypothetical protein